jgi:hypothetical protein
MLAAMLSASRRIARTCRGPCPPARTRRWRGAPLLAQQRQQQVLRLDGGVVQLFGQVLRFHQRGLGLLSQFFHSHSLLLPSGNKIFQAELETIISSKQQRCIGVLLVFCFRLTLLIVLIS